MPKYFLDRSLGGIKVPRTLRTWGWDLITMHEHYGKSRAQTVDDVTWIAEMTSLGFMLMTSDTRIVRTAIEAEAILSASAIAFILPKGDMTSQQMAERYNQHRAAIDERSARPGPAVYAIYPRTVSLVFP